MNQKRAAEADATPRRPWIPHQTYLEETMYPIMTQSGPNAHADLDAVARKRADRLARATGGEMEAALALLSMLDPEAFAIAFTAVRPALNDDEEPIAVCCECGGLVGIFPDLDLRWQHFRGNGTTADAQQVYDAGHDPEVTWILPDDDPDDLL
jgi:hypothetical protein